VYDSPGLEDDLLGIEGLAGSGLGDGVPEDPSERNEGSESLLESEDENRTVECRAEERCVDSIGEEGAVPLLGLDKGLAEVIDSSSLSTTSSNAGTGTLREEIVLPLCGRDLGLGGEVVGWSLSTESSNVGTGTLDDEIVVVLLMFDKILEGKGDGKARKVKFDPVSYSFSCHNSRVRCPNLGHIVLYPATGSRESLRRAWMSMCTGPIRKPAFP